MQRSLIKPVLILLACLIGVGLLENVDDYNPKPGPSALTLPPAP